MKSLRLLSTAWVLGIAVTACSSNNALTSVTPNQMQGALRNTIGPNGVGSVTSILPGWLSPDAKKQKDLLYVSDTGKSIIDIFSVPKYSMVGQITNGISDPEGLATDTKGNLYVTNLAGYTVTVYKPGTTRPSLTLTESNGPDDVAVGSNGYVYVGDILGGVDVYAPGHTSPSRRLTSSQLNTVFGVGVDGSNNVYGAGNGLLRPAVVKFVNAKGSGQDLGLRGLKAPSGVLIDNHKDVVVSDFARGSIFIYPAGQRSPSSKIPVYGPERSAINQTENEIYAPESSKDEVGIYTFPGGKFVTTIKIGAFTGGAALSPAPNP